MKAHDALKGTSVATFAENPCARMQNMHQSKDLREPVMSTFEKNSCAKMQNMSPSMML